MKLLKFALVFFLALLSSCVKKQDSEYTALALAQKTQAHDTGFVGSQSCMECHGEIFDQWKDSDHALAMQEADSSTVLGDFDNALHEAYGIQSKFFQRDGDFYINTQGADGQFKDFKVLYTFGYNPLQQYLVETKDGKLQVITPFWDNRPEEDGGQKWEHIYPDEFIATHDELHWDRSLQNWNFMCAECHSTNVKKNFDAVNSSYNTTWDEINVSCEACHGPGNLHNDWARSELREDLANKGFLFDIIDRDSTYFRIDPQSLIPERVGGKINQSQVEYCGRCHARRTQLTDDYTYGKPLENTHRHVLIQPDLYFDDGTINDEDYVYGSFTQSKMYHKGVSCKDCHNVHSTNLKAPGDAVCFQCHVPTKYKRKEHHFHEVDGAGGSCISCHMPQQYFMVVDERADHSMRIPRPDIAQEIGSLDACTNCHKDKDVSWSASSFKKWYGDKYDSIGHYGLDLYKARKNYPGSQTAVIDLLQDNEIPDIIKASALAYLMYSPEGIQEKLLIEALQSETPIMRRAALERIAYVQDPAKRYNFAAEALSDSIYGVRYQAAVILNDFNPADFEPAKAEVIKRAQEIYQNQLYYFEDRASGLTNIATDFMRKGDYTSAQNFFMKALKLDSIEPVTYINFADLKRLQQRDDQAELILKKLIDQNPSLTQAYYALGFAQLRQKKNQEAFENFKTAYDLNPKDAQGILYYSLMLSDRNNKNKALEVLDQGLIEHPYNEQLRSAAYNLAVQTRQMEKAMKYKPRSNP